MKFFITFICVILAVISIAVMSVTENAPPEPVVEEIKPEPKQSPYVIYVFVCGELEAVIVTSEPWMSVDRYNGGEPTDEMLELMLEAERTNRVLTFSGGFRFCSNAQPEYHD